MEALTQEPARLTSPNEDFSEKELQFKPEILLKASDGRQNCDDCIRGLLCCTLCLSCINNIFFCAQFCA